MIAEAHLDAPPPSDAGLRLDAFCSGQPILCSVFLRLPLLFPPPHPSLKEPPPQGGFDDNWITTCGW
jgi:hypothetical protein